MRSSDCERARRALAPDNRSPALSDEIALHLDGCRDCRRIFDAGRVVLDPGAFERLGDARREAMVAALAAARASRGRRWLGVAAAAALVVAAALLAASLGLGDRQSGRQPEVASALVEDHIRYLRSEDRRSGGDLPAAAATLELYVDFPLRIPLLAEGRLTGSRRCYLLDRRAALLFYDAPAGAVSYFVLEAGNLSPPGRPCAARPSLACSSLKGYRVVSWEKAGLLHAVVGPDSDLVDGAAKAVRDSLDRDIDLRPMKGDQRP